MQARGRGFMQSDNDEIDRTHAAAILGALCEAPIATAQRAKLNVLTYLFQAAKLEVEDLRASISKQ